MTRPGKQPGKSQKSIQAVSCRKASGSSRNASCGSPPGVRGFDPLQKVDRIPRPGMRRSIGNEGTIGKRWNAGVLSGVRAAAMLSDAGRFPRDGRSVVGTPPYLLSL